MTVMQSGFDGVIEVPHGDIDAPDLSSFIGLLTSPCHSDVTGGCSVDRVSAENKSPLFKMSYFDKEFRSGLGYHQPSSPLSSVGIVAAATGATVSKYVARREVPIWVADSCTQCMDCITVCPDSALPNTAQDINTVIETAVNHYVSDEKEKKAILSHMDKLEAGVRADMLENVNDKDREHSTPFGDLVNKHLKELNDPNISEDSINSVSGILKIMPFAYSNSKAIFGGKEKKEAGEGGVFIIGLRDTCKGCGACVEVCDKEAFKMSPESEQMIADNNSNIEFMNLLPVTPSKYLGIFDQNNVNASKAAALQYHSMLYDTYNAFLAGDGACAGCGEKSILKYTSTLTETLMRPLYHAKANRLTAKAEVLRKKGIATLDNLKKKDKAAYNSFRKSVLHILMGYGSESSEVTESRIAADFKGNDNDIIQALAVVMEQEAENHKDLQAIEGVDSNGMCVMAMSAHTGCNSVFSSTPPNNPHPYPWMNSLFQDGVTIGWLMSESFIVDHSNRSVIPERLADFVNDDFEKGYSEDHYFRLTHFSDTFMTDREIAELPKVWAVGGDGGMGDIGFQNLSKVVLQNRPNMKVLLLDTQVYSNTGGQNSDSSVLAGGFDMNQVGDATQGKLTERKSVAETFMNGHGSPYIAQVSMANPSNFFKAIVDGLTYRGTAFFQAFTSCPPEHGVADYSSPSQALKVRDSRGMTEFVFNSGLGESYTDTSYTDTLNIKGNPSSNTDWFQRSAPVTKKRYTFTVAHWAFTEARFRAHHKIVKEEATKGMVLLEDLIQLITMDDITNRRYLDKTHRAYIPDFKVYTIDHKDDGTTKHHIVSTQMVIFCVERRKAWRMLQSRAGIENKDYIAQKELLAKIDKDEMSVEDFFNKSVEA
jgi:pyruvate-ferredoxin/flavodoxin oxidoreductase